MRRGSDTGCRRRPVFLAFMTAALFAATMLVPADSGAGGGIGGVGRIPPTTGQTPQGKGEASGKSGGSSGAASGTEGAGKISTTTGQTPKGAGPAPAGATTTVAPLPVSPKPFQLDPAVLAKISKGLLFTNMMPANDELEAALKETEKARHKVFWDLKYYRERAGICSKKTFTTEDQKAAGCAGTDTLDQCSDKLFQHCIGTTGAKEIFHKSRQKMLEESVRLEKASKEYSNKVKLIP